MSSPRVAPDATIVIPHQRGERPLRRCLETLTRESSSLEILVMDDASTDGSLSNLKNDFPGVRIIRSEDNLGFSESVNVGARESRAETLVILNDDVEVTAGWLKPLIEEMARDPSVAGCQPKILSKVDPSRFEYAGASGGYLDWLGYPFCRGRIFWHLEKDRGQYDRPADIFWASGSAFAIRRSLFMEAGLFDGDFFAHMEEIDLCWRLHRMGYRIRAVPRSVIYHQGAATLSYRDPRKNYLNHKNNLVMILKNSPLLWGLFILGMRLMFDSLESLFWFLCGDWKKARGIAAAAIWNLTHLRSTLRKRDSRNGSRLPQAGARRLPVYPGSIVLDYFLRGTKRFSQLRWTPRS